MMIINGGVYNKGFKLNAQKSKLLGGFDEKVRPRENAVNVVGSVKDHMRRFLVKTNDVLNENNIFQNNRVRVCNFGEI